TGRRPKETQTVPRDLKFQRLPAVLSDRFVHALARTFFNEGHDTSAASSATNLGRPRSVFHCGRDQFVDKRGCDSRSVAATPLPFLVQKAFNMVPIATAKRLVHFLGNARNLGEIPNDALVTIDVLLEDLPVVDP